MYGIEQEPCLYRVDYGQLGGVDFGTTNQTDFRLTIFAFHHRISLSSVKSAQLKKGTLCLSEA